MDGSGTKCCMKVDACEIFIYNAGVSYLPLSEMGHMAYELVSRTAISPIIFLFFVNQVQMSRH